MDEFAPQEEDVDDLFGITNNADAIAGNNQQEQPEPAAQPLAPSSEAPANVPQQSTQTESAPTTEAQPPAQQPQQEDAKTDSNAEPPAQSKEESKPPPSAAPPQPSKDEFVEVAQSENKEKDDSKDNQSAAAKLDLSSVDSLQPDELVDSINNTIARISALDPLKDAQYILLYKNNLIKQLEKLQNISNAIASLNNMQKTADALPKNPKTGYQDEEAINLALREHCFFAEQVNVFGMLLVEISDVHKLRESYSSEYIHAFTIKLLETIEEEFKYEHLLFHYSGNRFVVLVYVENEQELMVCGKEIIRILTAHSFEISDQTLHSSVSVGAAIFQKDKNKEESNSFDFRTWLKNAELGLNKANSNGLPNQCGISHEDDTVRAIVPSMKDTPSGSHAQHTKSSLSLLARGGRTHSSGASTYNKLKVAEMQTHLTPQQIRASIRLYDKLSRIQFKEEQPAEEKKEEVHTKQTNGVLTREKYKLVALSLCRRLREQGANYNFPHPQHDGETILMLCCRRNFDILIKYFCLKVANEIDFNMVNNEGNNALMLAIMNKNVPDDIVKMIALKTTEKEVMNHEGKTAKQLAEQCGRTDLAPLFVSAVAV